MTKLFPKPASLPGYSWSHTAAALQPPGHPAAPRGAPAPFCRASLSSLFETPTALWVPSPSGWSGTLQATSASPSLFQTLGAV